MSILEILSRDHQKVKEILKKAYVLIEDFPKINVAQEKALMKKLLIEVEPHSKAEEKVFYKALKQKQAKSLSPYEGGEEHALVLKTLQSVQSNTLESGRRTARIKVIREMLLHHIGEEESKYFKEARANFSQEELVVLGEKFLKEKKKHLEKMKINIERRIL